MIDGLFPLKSIAYQLDISSNIEKQPKRNTKVLCGEALKDRVKNHWEMNIHYLKGQYNVKSRDLTTHNFHTWESTVCNKAKNGEETSLFWSWKADTPMDPFLVNLLLPFFLNPDGQYIVMKL